MEIDPHVDRRLREDAVVLLTTVRPDGRPFTAPVWFSWANPVITIYTPSTTARVRNIAANPAVALALDSFGGTDVVLLEATAELGSAGEGAAAGDEQLVAKYGSRVPDMAGWAELFDRRITVTVTAVRAWNASYD